MTYLFVALAIAAIGYAVYRLRASFTATQDAPPAGPIDDGKLKRPIDKR